MKVNDGAVITATGHTITLGDGTDPAGLIMGGGSAAITGGTLAFGGSEAFIYAKGTSTISAEITGSNGLVLAGSGTLQLSTAAALSGQITLNSGELSSDRSQYLFDECRRSHAPERQKQSGPFYLKLHGQSDLYDAQ